jgi:hypothetical protein
MDIPIRLIPATAGSDEWKEGSIGIKGYIRTGEIKEDGEVISYPSQKARVARNSVIRVYQSKSGTNVTKSLKALPDLSGWDLVRTIYPEDNGSYLIGSLPQGYYMVVVDIPGYTMDVPVYINATDAEDGTMFTLYDLVVTDDGQIVAEMLPFDEYVRTKWGNSFILNKKRLREVKEFVVTGCTWYDGDGVQLAEGFSYSAGATLDQQLPDGGVYQFILSTTVGDLRSTRKEYHSEATPVGGVLVYPNPATQGQPVYVATKAGSVVAVYNALGKLVGTANITGTPEALTLSLTPGVYFVKANGQTAKLIVK